MASSAKDTIITVTVSIEDIMPEDYIYIPDHHRGISSQYQDLTLAHNRVLYVVVADDFPGQRLGIRVPCDVVQEVFHLPTPPIDDNDFEAGDSFADSEYHPAEWYMEMPSDGDDGDNPSEWYEQVPSDGDDGDHPPEWYEQVPSDGDDGDHPPEWYDRMPFIGDEHPPEWYSHEPPSSFEW
ncbi:hypothetical protein F5B21DRAFT_494490 [Xylaria acuta]|nr:hypothetical protein F5B21DRAFT_494490 [Xylaria acuta]